MAQGSERGNEHRPTELRRFLPIVAVLAAAAAIWGLAGDTLSFAGLERNHAALIAWRDANLPAAVAGFFVVYVVVVATSVPGAVWLSLVGGLLFGIVGGTAIVVAAATLGATLVFLAARSALGDALRARAGGWAERLERGFRQGESSFLLILRLVPVVPFFVVNLVAAVLGARLATFVWTTFLGIIPGTIVFISVGAGLGEQIGRGERPDPGVIFEPHILLPLLGLAALAALPLLLRRFGLLGAGIDR